MCIHEPRPDERVMIFIDLRNVTAELGELLDTCRLDFEEMASRLCGGRRLVRALVFDGCPHSDRTRGFHNYLRSLGFTVVVRGCPDDCGRQKEVDVALAVEMVSKAHEDQYDAAVLVSGDRDFVPAVEEVKDLGKRVEIASLRNCLSYGLRMSADAFVSLDRMPILRIKDAQEAIL